MVHHRQRRRQAARRRPRPDHGRDAPVPGRRGLQRQRAGSQHGRVARVRRRPVREPVRQLGARPGRRGRDHGRLPPLVGEPEGAGLRQEREHHLPRRHPDRGLRLRLRLGRRDRQPRGRVLGRPDDREHPVDRGLPRRHLLGGRGELPAVRRRPPALLRQHRRRRLPADLADLDVPPPARLLGGDGRNPRARPDGLLRLGRNAVPGAAGLLPELHDRHLHRAEPGDVVDRGQLEVHRRRRRVPQRQRGRLPGPDPLRRPLGRAQQGGTAGHPARPEGRVVRRRPGACLLERHVRPGQRLPDLQGVPRRRHHAGLHDHPAVQLLHDARHGLRGHRARAGIDAHLSREGLRPRQQLDLA